MLSPDRVVIRTHPPGGLQLGGTKIVLVAISVFVLATVSVAVSVSAVVGVSLLTASVKVAVGKSSEIGEGSVLPSPSICRVICRGGSWNRATGHSATPCEIPLHTYLASEGGFATVATVPPLEAPVKSALG